MKTTKIKDKLWKVISEYIRLRDSVDGYVTCCTCGKIYPINKSHAGHFIPAAQGNSTRWDETNIHGQCETCNIDLRGNRKKYEVFMVEKYGQAYVDELMSRSNVNKPMKYHEYEELLEYYQNKLRGIK